MNRQQRQLSRIINRHNSRKSSSEHIFNNLDLAGIPSDERENFIRWATESLWSTYKSTQMDRRIEIENEVRNSINYFPNGTANKNYSYSFRLPLHLISDISLDGIEEAGLNIEISETGECQLSGVPRNSGDYKFSLCFHTLPGQPVSVISFPVVINPDPRSLWRNIPTNRDIPYFKTDSDLEYIKVDSTPDGTPRKDIVAASARGRSHAQEGKPRDDHFAIEFCPDSEWYILAVADGAGSAKFSRKGSESACKSVVSHCRNMLADNPEFEKTIRDFAGDKGNPQKRTELTRKVIDIIFKGAVKAHEEVKKVAAANQDAVLKDFATTLMFAIVKKYDFGWFVASFWVGDGAMCLFDRKNKTAKLLGTPDEGEFSGQTRFLTMPEIFHDKEVVSRRLRMAVVPDFTALFLMSDGVSDPMFETEKNLNDFTKWEVFWQNLLNGFPEDGIEGVNLCDDNPDCAGQLLDWLGFWSPGNHDDRTIAILY